MITSESDKSFIQELISLFIAVADLGEGALQQLVYLLALTHCLLKALLDEVAVGERKLGLGEGYGVFRGDEVQCLKGGILRNSGSPYASLTALTPTDQTSTN